MTDAKSRVARSRRASSAAARTISAAEFKARCLELMDHVSETGVEYVVTKHRRPVAKLVRCAVPKSTPVFGAMKGTVLKYERPFDPVDGEWDVNGA
jgi:prevent-host-death family protein